jgi:tetratricopeptide (TPR) repeat protein
VPESERAEFIQQGFAQALKRLLAGDAETGLALYRDALRSVGRRAPVGIHALALERSARHEEAAALRRLALAAGADLSVKGQALDAAPADRAREYETLIASGLVNSQMVWNYLLVLAELGRSDEIAALLAPARLLRQVRLDVDAAAVEAFLLREEQSGLYQEAHQSVRRMTKIERLQRFDDPAVLALLEAVREEMAFYMRDWAAQDHPLAGLMPRSFRLRSWGLVSHGDGYNVRHMHHRGWVTAVYYPTTIPPGEGVGCLRVGCPDQLGDTAPGWPDVAIRPVAGLLVLMPSYYPHWTVPLGREGLRTSVAFDVAITDRE